MSPRLPSRRSSAAHQAHQDALQRRVAQLSADAHGYAYAAGANAAEDDCADEGEDDWLEPPSSRRVPDASPVPEPGRHAARRPGARMRDLLDTTLPEPLRGRVRLGPAQLTVVALVVAVGLAVTCWWLIRSRPDELQAPAVRPAGEPALAMATPPLSAVAAEPSEAAPSPAPAAAASSDGAPTPTGSVTVDVAGKVRRPGIVVLDAGARVVDAVDAAGGARRGVDLTPLNLARALVDGEQVLVGVAGGGTPPVPGGPPTPAAGGSSAASGPAASVDLNTATQEQLETLPRVGPVTAAAILAWRDTHGRFTAVEELLEVDGIGDATLAQLTPYVRV